MCQKLMFDHLYKIVFANEPSSPTVIVKQFMYTYHSHFENNLFKVWNGLMWAELNPPSTGTFLF